MEFYDEVEASSSFSELNFLSTPIEATSEPEKNAEFSSDYNFDFLSLNNDWSSDYDLSVVPKMEDSECIPVDLHEKSPKEDSKSSRNNRKNQTPQKRSSNATPKISKKAKGNQNNTNTLIKREKDVQTEDKYEKRLEANKKSAQASRERKKAMKSVLENEAAELQVENKELTTAISVLQTENEMLKGELLSLQEMLFKTPMAKLMENKENMEALQNNSTASSWYTLIVLHIFSQYFQSMAGNNPNTSSPAPQPNWVM